MIKTDPCYCKNTWKTREFPKIWSLTGQKHRIHNIEPVIFILEGGNFREYRDSDIFSS